jgi:poly-gamma-glutamate capsule biosynthesis protein CapA/YwtB (metallophosphatase superfamily)
LSAALEKTAAARRLLAMEIFEAPRNLCTTAPPPFVALPPIARLGRPPCVLRPTDQIKRLRGVAKMIDKAPLMLLLLKRGLWLVAMASSFAIGGAVSHAQRLSDVTLPPVARDVTRELATKITQPFVFAAVGDVWATTRPNAPLNDPRLQSLFGIMRSADMTYANMEGPIIDYGAYNGPHVGSSKTFVGELQNMGIRIMTTANNHAMDAGPEGVFMTNRLLDEAGIAHAGTGRNLTEARRPAIATTPKGTVAAVGMYSIDITSSNPGYTRYSDARTDWPGVNPLHVEPTFVVSAEQMQDLRRIRDAVYARRSQVLVPVAPISANEPKNRISLFGTQYKAGDPADVGNLSYAMDRKDFREIIQSVREGKQLSDFMAVAIHCHVNSFAFQAYSHDNSTPDFLVELAHAAIDNGADVFVGHGVHTLRGIEIYNGKPIFYGISNFIYQNSPIPEITDPSRPDNGLLDRTHQPDNKEALLTTSRYEEGQLVEVRLYPVDLGIDGTRPVSRNGQPLAASPQQAERILKIVQDLSRPFGTSIAIENGVGVILVGH